MLDRLMHHGYGVHHAIPGGKGGWVGVRVRRRELGLGLASGFPFESGSGLGLGDVFPQAISQYINTQHTTHKEYSGAQ